MWRNYLLVAARSLAKNRAYAAITIAGLALGLAACVLMLLYVRYETRYDAWMPGADRVFQLQTHYDATSTGSPEMDLQVSSIVSGRALRKDYPDLIEKSVWVRAFGPVVIQDGEAGRIEDLRSVDADFFAVFDVPFVRGSARTALRDTRSITLSESEARRRFGNANPIGRTLTLVENTGPIDYKVTGVFRDWPADSSFSANAVARIDLDAQFADRSYQLTNWSTQQGWNFFRLRAPGDAAVINARMDAWEKRNIPTSVSGNPNPGEYQDYRLVDLRDVHLGKAQAASITPGNDRTTVATFGAIALLVLAMACVNFTNLATARASQRAREVALRKVLGASRRQLVTQFLAEALLVTAIATAVALAAVELVLPAFNAFLDARIVLHYWGRDGILLPLAALVVVVGLVAGAYPAFYLSRFEPARILKANRSGAEAHGSGRLRGALVVGQFAVSIALIICTAIVFAQTRYARTVDAGFVRDGLLQVDNIGMNGVAGRDAELVEQVRRIPGVVAAARTEIAVAPNGNSAGTVQAPGAADSVELGQYGIEPGFFRAMGMRMVAGRDFSLAQGRDDATTPAFADAGFPAAARGLAERGVNVVVTREAARRLGFATPAAALGVTVKADMLPPEYGRVPTTIVGVVDDARFRSVRDAIQPIMFTMQTKRLGDMVVRFDGDPARIREAVEAAWKRLIPQVPFAARFADDLVREQYDREEARGQLFGAFAVLAVVIGCLGLFGLAAFTAERRTKEIGVRKVLGARTRDIVRLLVWQFSRPVLVANVIAWPVAWWAMRGWLNGFDAAVPLTPWPFLGAGALALAIAVVTVAGHAWRVGRTSPVRALRYE